MSRKKFFHRMDLTRTSFSFPMFLTIYFLINFQFTFVIGTKMLSTSTPSPEGLTTPKDSAVNKEALKTIVTDFLTLAVSMKNLKLAEGLLTNASFVQKMEDELLTFQNIATHIEKHYRFRIKRKSPINSCALEYAREKQLLVREFETLLKDCKNTMENFDVLHFAKADKMDSLILHGCSERTKTIHLDVARLIGQIHEISYICTVETVKNILEELVVSKWLVYINENSKLLFQELDYLVKNYESILGSARTKETVSLDKNVVDNLKLKFEKFKQVSDSGAINEEIVNFTKSAERLLQSNGTRNKNPERNSGLYSYSFASSLKEIFEEYFQIPDVDDVSVENWARSPGLYKVVVLNNKLKETISNLSLSIPKYGAFRRAQLDLRNANLFRGNSPTFGKPCENSPHHLVGTCTAENHEICRHVVENWGTDDDQELLPKEELVLLGNLELKHCTCGFRTNCERQSGRRGTCFLIPNSEGQCRGGEGYPCRTEPLEAGGYDESCVSGYCNLEKNSCEVDHFDDTGLKRFKRIVKTKLERLTHFY